MTDTFKDKLRSIHFAGAPRSQVKKTVERHDNGSVEISEYASGRTDVIVYPDPIQIETSIQ